MSTVVPSTRSASRGNRNGPERTVVAVTDDRTRTRDCRGRRAPLRGASGADAQPAQGARRQGDGPRLAGRRAQGRAVSLRRRRAGLPVARGPRAPPDGLPRRGREAAAADRGRDAHGQHEAPAARRSAPRPPPASSGWRTASSSARTRRPRWASCATCGATASPARSTCSARRPSPRPRPSATPRRCAEALDTLVAASAAWPARPQLERDSAGPLPRANLSVKVSALTPLLRPDAPERGKRDAAERLRPLLRRAKELGAHLHIDMESLDSRDAVLELILELLSEEEFREGPSAGMVLQAYLRDSPQTLDTILEWLAGAGGERAHAADDPARQGRLLGPRDRRGAPARLAGAGLRAQGRHRPQLRGAHAAAARRARAGRRCASRSPRTTCARSATRSPTTA